jgi:DNA-binding NarL/FixJ family response regulator
MPEVIHVAVVEDDRETLDGLYRLIDRAAGFRCVGGFQSAEELLARQREEPHVFLVDIQLPGMPGWQLVARLRERGSSSPILMLTAYGDDDKVFASICNGAQGYLLKKTPADRLLEYIREVCAGGAPMSPEIARKVIDAFRQAVPRRADQSGLKPHEVRLLALLADGYSYEAAGRELKISINTVRSYIRSIYDTLQVHSKSAAVGKALRTGIL